MDKLKMQTPNLTNEKFAALAAMFPNAVTETVDENGAVVRAIDKDVLAQEINAHVVEGKEERYQFTWPDKKKSVLLANAPIAAALRPCREESVNFDTTENLYIEGDNLDVLKLLRETYLNRVKMIYIDPPYNTGNDFVYEDDFSEDADEFYARDYQYDEDGNRMVKNLDSNGRFHTDWLNMIYPRLRAARDLLGDNGAVFISCDDNEVNNLRKACDDIFGASNFIAQVIVQTNPRGRTFDRFIAKTHEYIIIYSKNIEFDALREIPKDEKAVAGYQKEDANGKYRLLELRNRNPVFNRTNRPLMFYPFYADPDKLDVSLTPTEYHTVEIYPRNSEGLDGCWTWGLEKATNEIHLLVANLANTGKWSVFRKDYLEGTSLFTKAKGLWLEKEMNHENGKEMVRELFRMTPFDFPKSVDYIKKCLLLGTSSYSEDLILDFFSGSATTAHAVMQLNAEDGGKRKFIMVQLPELTDENSEAFKAGYKNICEIGKERIRRAGNKVISDKCLVASANALKNIIHCPLNTNHSLDVISNEEKAKYGCKELSRSDCLAKINGSGKANLLSGEEASEGGALCSIKPDAESSSVNPVEYSGGTSTNFNERVSSIHSNCKREQGRTGNTTFAVRESGIPCRYGHFGSDDSASGDWENAECAHKNTNHCPLNTNHSLDTGFRVLKLDSSNMKDVYYTPQEYTVDMVTLEGLVNNIKSGRSTEDLLFQVMLDLGIPLSARIVVSDKWIVANKQKVTVYSVFTSYPPLDTSPYLIACFEAVDDATVTEIARKKPYYAVFRDSSFASDSTLVSYEQIFKTYSPATQRRVL